MDCMFHCLLCLTDNSGLILFKMRQKAEEGKRTEEQRERVRGRGRAGNRQDNVEAHGSDVLNGCNNSKVLGLTSL